MSWLSRLLGYVPADERKGISLSESNAWKASPVKDFSAFVRALADLMPDGSVLYLEGGVQPSEELVSYLEARTPKETTKVEMGTIWPRPRCFHMGITSANLEGLADVAERDSTIQPAIHLHVYRNDKVLLSWYDAFWKLPFYVSSEVSEDKLKAFCGKLKTDYCRSSGDLQGAQSD